MIEICGEPHTELLGALMEMPINEDIPALLCGMFGEKKEVRVFQFVINDEDLIGLFLGQVKEFAKKFAEKKQGETKGKEADNSESGDGGWSECEKFIALYPYYWVDSLYLYAAVDGKKAKRKAKKLNPQMLGFTAGGLSGRQIEGANSAT